MARSTIAAVLLIATLAACEAGGTEGPAGPEAGATAGAVVSRAVPDRPTGEEAPELRSADADDEGCGADKLGRWLNALPTGEVKAEIARAVRERPIRYYAQGDPITMDFSPARLNVELGKDGRIKLFRCG
jgi:hypothetical protein